MLSALLIPMVPPRSRSPVSSPQLDLFGDAPTLVPKATGKPFELNDRQREAVEHVHGPMLVVAGAGTGKTTVLTQRIARLIREGHCRADEILAVTYTDNAAAELLQRVTKELGVGRTKDLKATTFHGFCYGILQRRGKAFRVIEPQDLWVYLRRRLPDLKLKYYTRAASPAQFLDSLLDFFDNCHDELKTADDYESYLAALELGKHPLPRVTRSKDADKLTPVEVLARCREIACAFRTVETMLERDGLGTFGHMLLRAMQLLRAEPKALAAERAGTRFILIDEFQDSNIAQIELAQTLAGDEGNIFAVGDPDQAIYRFRGASSAAFEEFASRFPQTKSVTLDRNQRSTSAILNCSYAVIGNNPPAVCRLGKSGQQFDRQPLTSDRDRRTRAEGKPVQPELVELVMVAGSEDEAADVGSEIERRLRQHGSASSQTPRIAVLYRQHNHRTALVRELAARGIPFRVEGLNALETAEVRDLLACLRSLHAPPDNASLFRVAALPIFKINAAEFREDLRAAGRQPDIASVLAQTPATAAVLKMVENARIEAAAANWQMAALVEIVIKRFGLDRAAPPVVAFREFVRKWAQKAITIAGDLKEFLEYMEYFPQAGGSIAFDQSITSDPADTVSLMTVHAAKGLEFDHVFVVRANANSFPTNYKEKLFEMPQAMRDPRCLAPGDGPELHKQEERRLFYVAMTRARDSLAICGRVKGKNPKPSGFVRELTESHVAHPGWRERPADAKIELAAAAEANPASGLGAWLLLPATPRALGGSLSATAIETYQLCPLKFKIQRDWNVPGEVAASLQFGAAVHQTLRDFFDAMLAARPRTREEFLRIFGQVMADTPFDDEHQRELYLRQGRAQLEQFFDVQAQAPPPAVISTEKTFEIEVEGVRIRGRIDRMDRVEGDRVAIIDYKTGAAKNEIDARTSLQLSIYAIAAREHWRVFPERLIFYNLETNEQVVGTREERELRTAKEKILDAARNIAAGHFEATPGFHCRSCGYYAMCPATEERLYSVGKVSAASLS